MVKKRRRHVKPRADQRTKRALGRMTIPVRVFHLIVVLSFIMTSAGPGFAAILQQTSTSTEPGNTESQVDQIAQSVETEETPSAPNLPESVTPTEPSPTPGIVPAVEMTATATLPPTEPLPTATTPPIIETIPPPTPAPARAFTVTVPVTLTLSTKTPFLSPGGPLSLGWNIENFDTLPQDENLQLAVTAPEGFVLRGNYNGEYDPNTNTLTFTPTKDKGKVKWVAGDDSYGPYDFTAALSYAGQNLSTDLHTLNEQNLFVINQSGGRAIGVVNGMTVTVDIPNGALPEPIDLRMIPPGFYRPPYASEMNTPTTLLTAIGRVSGQPITQFSQDLTIQLTYDETMLYGNEASMVMRYYNEVTERWVTVRSQVDEENNVLTGWMDHFTEVGGSIVDWEAARLPTVENFQVAQFTGAGTYSQSFWVPPGPGGLQPSLTLSYNSQVVDSATYYTQASWVGMGWSLDIGYIQRNQHGTPEDFSDDTFSIVANGVSGMLLRVQDPPDTPPDVDVYRIADDNFWRIWAYTSNGIITEWVAWDKTGTKYTFGDLPSSTGDTRAEYYICGEDEYRYWRWPLVTVETAHNLKAGNGDALTYLYNKDGKDFQCNESSPLKHVDLDVVPAEIHYPNGKYRVVFTRVEGSRTDWNDEWADSTSRVFYSDRRLGEVMVQNWDSASGWQTIRKYDFIYADETTPETDPIYPEYTWSSGGRNLTLVAIEEYGVEGVQPLPATTFHYDVHHLISVDNGYGGEVELDYERWSTPNDSNVDMAIGYPGSCSGAAHMNGWKELNESNDEVACDNGNLKFTGSAYQSIRLQDLLPGTEYRLIAIDIEGTSSNSQLKFGFDHNGDGTIDVQSATPITLTQGSSITVDDRLVLPLDAANDGNDETDNDARFVVTCTNGCKIQGHIRLSRVLTRYRVVNRTVSETAVSPNSVYTYTYTYTNPVVNGPLGVWEKEENYNQPRGVFLGHGSVEVVGPDGVKTITYFHQDDILKGRAYKVEVLDGSQLVRQTDTMYEYYSYDHAGCTHNGAACGTDVNSYDPIVILPTNENNDIFEDLQLSWAFANVISETVAAPSSDAIKTATRYEYNDGDQLEGGSTPSQYGNITNIFKDEATLSLTSEGTYEWSTISETWTRYYPKDNASGGEYFVGLPGWTHLHECDGTACTQDDLSLLSSVWYLYDESIDYDEVPTEGILTGKRTLVCFLETDTESCVDASEGYDLIRFSDEQYEYDVWGNQKSVKKYRNYGNYDPVSDISTPAWNTGSPLEQETYTTYDDSYHTFAETISKTVGISESFITTMTYTTTHGLPTTVEGPNGPGTIVEMFYDEYGRLIKTVHPGDTQSSPTTSYSYWDSSEPLPFYTEATAKVDDGTSFSVRKYYDGLGRLVQSQSLGLALEDGACSKKDGSPDTCKAVTFFNFDNAGRPFQQSVPVVKTNSGGFDALVDWEFVPSIKTGYDSLGRVAEIIDTAGITTTYAYGIDTDGNGVGRSFTTITDAAGNSTTSYLDRWGRLDEVVPALGPGLQYDYNTLGQMTGVTKGTSVVTTIDYDLAGRKVSMDDPDMGAWSYSYDALGNLEWQQDALGQVTCFYYDDLNRLTGKHYQANTECLTSPALNVAYYYDDYDGFSAPQNSFPIGHRTVMSDSSGVTIWEYDERGRVTQENKIIGSATFTTTWEYGSSNQVITMTYPTGEEVVFGYHPQFSVDSVTGASNYVQESVYDEAGRLVQRELGPGLLQADYAYYDWSAVGAGRLENLLVMGGSALQNLTYTYDNVGNVLTIVDALAAGGPQTQTFTYDALNRLDTAVVSGGNDGTFPLEDYDYDSDGRLLGYTSEGGSMTLDFEDPDHFHAATSADFGGGEVNTYEYDANGNMVTRVIVENGVPVTYTLDMDPENRLVAVEKGGEGHYNFIYDGDGNRVKAENTLTGEETYYVGNYFEMTVSDSYCRAANLAIPNNNESGVTDTLTISGMTGTLSDLNVQVEIDHPFVGELVVKLTHVQSGKSINLIHRPGYPPGTSACSGDDIDARLDDEAARAVESECAGTTPTISGSFIPNQNLATFDEESLNGDWQLNVSDREGGGNTGTLVNWCLDATGPVMAQGGTSQPMAAGEEGGPPRLLARIVPRSAVMQAALSSVESLKELLQIGSSPASNEVWKSYYYAGGQRVAVRVQDPNAPDVDATYYLLGDHLGSTSLTVDENGAVIDERRYKPWGEVRFESSGAGVTDFGYTGQRQNDSFGLYFYNARWYDPYLNQFTQPDSIIPKPNLPTDHNRYSYVRYNPKYSSKCTS